MNMEFYLAIVSYALIVLKVLKFNSMNKVEVWSWYLKSEKKFLARG